MIYYCFCQLFYDGKKQGCWTQIGIVSWGWGCGQFIGNQQIPGFYTNVLKFTSWIANKTAENDD